MKKHLQRRWFWYCAGAFQTYLIWAKLSGFLTYINWVGIVLPLIILVGLAAAFGAYVWLMMDRDSRKNDE